MREGDQGRVKFTLFHPSQIAEKRFGLRDGIGPAGVAVEEPMRLALVEMQIAADSCIRHGFLESLQGLDRDELVVGAKKYDGWWGFFGDVVRGRKLFGFLADPIVAPIILAVVEHGIEEQEGGGFG